VLSHNRLLRTTFLVTAQHGGIWIVVLLSYGDRLSLVVDATRKKLYKVMNGESRQSTYPVLRLEGFRDLPLRLGTGVDPPHSLEPSSWLAWMRDLSIQTSTKAANHNTPPLCKYCLICHFDFIVLREFVGSAIVFVVITHDGELKCVRVES
jgi:hypothetical protein